MAETQTENPPQTSPAPLVQTAPQQESDSLFLLDETNVALLTRTLLGLSLEGAEFLLARLTAIQEIIDEDRQQGELHFIEQESRSHQMRYLAIGLLLRGERAAINAAQSGLSTAAQATGWLVGLMNGVTDNRLVRPFRQPFDQLVDRLVAEAQLSLAEGRVAEQDGRLLAKQITSEVIDEIIEYISDNPALEKLVRSQIGQQGVTMTSTVVENARSVTVSGDNLLERIARKVLGRAPRTELPPSPFVGKPQTMYTPEERVADTDSGVER